ncbi:MAG TPA: hypothetical protein VEI02_14775 [Planctomycetota bacterium]|nr:hypothetical protein [Planctomycetota bacterium]
MSSPLHGVRILAVAAVAACAAAGQNDWTGAVSDDWFDAGNWSTAAVPTAADDVTILSGRPLYPRATAGTAACASLFIATAAAPSPTDALFVGAGATLEVWGHFHVSDDIGGTGELRLTGPTSILLDVSKAPDPSLVLDKAGATITVGAFTGWNGAFTLLGGALDVGSHGVSFGGVAVFAGGSYAADPASTEFFGAPGITFSGTSVTGHASFLCTAGFSADAAFQPTSGEVLMTGTGVVVNAGRFIDFTIGDDAITTLGATEIQGLVKCQGQLTVAAGAIVTAAALQISDGTSPAALICADAAALLVVTGDASILGGSVASGLLNLDVGGDATFAAGVAPTSGRVRLIGPGVQGLNAAGPLAVLRVEGGQVVAVDDVSCDRLEIVSGAFTLAAGVRCDVAGDLDAVGGALASSDGVATFAVTGAASFASCAVAARFELEVAGDCATDAAFAPNDGTVRFVGSGAQAVSGVGAYVHVAVEASSVVSASGLRATGDVDVAGQLIATASFDVDGDVDALAGTLDLGGADHALGGDLLGSSAFSATGLLKFDGSAGATVSVATALPAVQVAKPVGVVVQFGSVPVLGDLAVVSGTARFATLAVGGAVTVSPAGDLVANAASVGGDLAVQGALRGVDAVLLDGLGGAAVGGAVPGLIVAKPAGVTVVADALTVAGDLLVQSGTLQTISALDVDGDLAVAAAGTFDAGAFAHAVGADLDLQGALAAAAVSRFVLDGATPATVASVAPLPALEAAKSGGGATVAGVTVAGELLLTSGSLTVGSNTAVGALTAQGGVFASAPGTTPLQVAGAASFAGTTAGFVALVVQGDWASDDAFTPPSGSIVFAGPGVRHLQGASLSKRFGAASVTFAGGVTTAAAQYDFDGPVTVAAGAVFDAGPFTQTFASDFSCLGGLVPDGAYEFDGAASAAVLSVSAFPAVRVAKDAGVVVFGGAAAPSPTVASLYLQKGGLRVGDGATLHVTGGADLDALGTFETGAGAVLDVDGDLTVRSQTTGAAEIRLSGNLTYGAGFAPASGTLTFDGAGAAQDVTVETPAGAIRNLAATAGATVDVDVGGLHVAGSTLVDGVLQSAAPCTFDGPFTVSASGSFDGGDAAHVFKDDVLVFGQMIHVTQVVCEGAASAEIGGAAPFPPVRADLQSGLASLQLGGTLPFETAELTLVEGFAFVPPGVVARVLGNAVLENGAFVCLDPAAILDVDGDVEITQTAVGGLANLNCGGAWHAGDSFAPTAGRVRLDDPAGTALMAKTPFGTLHFATLEIAAGTATVSQDLEFDADLVQIAAGAGLRVTTATLRVPATAFAVAGEVAIDVGGRLELGDAAPLVVPAGATLRLAGSPAAPAQIVGTGAAGFDVRVEGGLAARNFVLERPAPQGFVIEVTATLDPAPDDFRGGVLTTPAPAGVLLDVRRAAAGGAPTELRHLVFLDPASAPGAANVRAPFGTPVVLAGATGAFAGEPFDDDPANRVTWATLPAPAASSFVATPGPFSVALVWTTVAETDVERFDLERRDLPAGDFAVVHAPTAAGPSTYAFLDQPLPGGQPYEYRLSAVLTHGASVVLGLASATTSFLAAPLPPNVLSVGPTGDYATPAAAVAAALALGTGHATVRLAPGTYPSFTVTQAPLGGLRIVADGAGPVFIDAASAPLRVVGLASGGVQFQGLSIVGVGGAGPAAEILQSTGTVLFDACDLQSGQDAPALRVASSGAVALQSSAAWGELVDVSAEIGSDVELSRSEIARASATGGSTIRAAGCDATITTDAASSVVVYEGAMPLLLAPSFASLGAAATLALHGEPGRPWVLAAAFAPGFLPPSGPLQMALRLDVASLIPLADGVLDGAGVAATAGVVPNLPALAGVTLWFQGATYDPAAGALRFSTTAATTLVP